MSRTENESQDQRLRIVDRVDERTLMRVLLSRIQYHGVSLDAIRQNQDAVKAGAEDRFPRTVVVENAIGYAEAVNVVVGNVGKEVRQFDKSTIAVYEIDRNGKRVPMPLPNCDAVYDAA